MAKRSQTRGFAVAALIGVLAASPASSACMFCKGGAFSIDKPFDKGGALSIDKPFDFMSKSLARIEKSASEFLKQAIDVATALLQKLVVWLGVAIAVVLGFALVLAMGLTSLILRRNRAGVVEGSSAH